MRLYIVYLDDELLGITRGSQQDIEEVIEFFPRVRIEEIRNDIIEVDDIVEMLYDRY